MNATVWVENRSVPVKAVSLPSAKVALAVRANQPALSVQFAIHVLALVDVALFGHFANDSFRFAACLVDLPAAPAVLLVDPLAIFGSSIIEHKSGVFGDLFKLECTHALPGDESLISDTDA